MSYYTQLTLVQRYIIYRLLKFGCSQTVIATANLYRGRNHRRAPRIYTAAATVPRRAPHIFD